MKKAWPTKKAMEQVYEMNLWGGETEFYSGEGSHLPELVEPYIDVVTTFLSSFDDRLVVCDLGCGDFNIGSRLVKHTSRYIAVDIVSNLIARNKEKYRADNLEFLCLDIAVDELPMADCAIIRQVFQHLSNNEIECVVQKLAHYKYVIVTEHLPEGNFVPNADIISGQGIRLKKQSGVDLMEPPFKFKVLESKNLLSVPLNNAKGVIETTLYSVR